MAVQNPEYIMLIVALFLFWKLEDIKETFDELVKDVAQTIIVILIFVSLLFYFGVIG